MASNMVTSLDERMRRVRFIATDVDGVLTDGRMWFDGEGRQFRWIHARDTSAFTLWHMAGGKSALVTGMGSQAVEMFAKTWKCAEYHMWIKDKARVCREMAERHGILLDEMAFLGDDIIDLFAIQSVGLGVAVADAVPEVRAAAGLVLDAQGGYGALRELVQRILLAQGRLDEVVHLYCNRKDHIQ